MGVHLFLMYKAKFESWVEVNIGGRWYVISNAKQWRMLQHLWFFFGEWDEVIAVPPYYQNEILEGHSHLQDFSGTWDGWWNANYNGL
jgi:hypothetical protein